MVKAIFTSAPKSKYDDSESRYHFPRTYLNFVKRTVGDWIIYYEPRRISRELGTTGGRQAYYATALVEKVIQDPNRGDHFYALMRDFLPFDHNVPFQEDGIYYEKRLQKEDGTTNRGQFGRAVRLIEEAEYNLILRAGFEIALMGEDAFYLRKQEPIRQSFELAESDQEPFLRPIVESLVKRPFRDSAFRHAVRNAYRDTCAITGLSIRNGGGRPEVQAAHIQPVADQGPDAVNNGIALSGTVHWMFDRHLLSIDEDYSILVANDRIPSQMKSLILGNKKIILPERIDQRPHPKYLEHHRRQFQG